ncbi:MAG TPA: restriction endonuclease subunit S [Anaerolineales bacterium]|nr:restriction endonuclease subunit S [Anaerolineales bacterium]
MKGWKETELGKIGKDVRRSFKPSNEIDMPYIGYEHIEQGTLRLLDYGSSKDIQSDKKLFKKGEIIFGTLRPYFRKVIIPQFDGICSTDLAVINANKGYDQKFLFYILASQPLIDFADVSSNGTKMPRAKWSVLSKTLWNVPELPTQQRIASILSAYDDLIEVNNQRIKLLEQTARELYKEWFVRMRFPGYKQAKFKKGVPEGWRTIAISDVVDFKMGQSPKSEFYNEEGVGLPFHQGVGNYGLRFPEHKIYCSVNGRLANEGDVLFSVRAPVGRLNIADRKLIIGRGLAALRHKKGLNNYLFYLLQNEFSKEDLIGNGSIFNSVGKDELKKFKIFDVGDLAKQFNKLVKPIDEQLLVLIQQNSQLRQIRDRLLPRLISGKLEVKELTNNKAVMA